jgi:hypothetical protein
MVYNSLRILFLVFLLPLSSCMLWDISRIQDNYLLKLLTLLVRDDSPLQVTSIIPKDKSTNNYRNTNVFLGFNKIPPGFGNSQIILKAETPGSVEEKGTLTQSGKFIVFTPANNLSANTTFTITVKAENGLSSETIYTFSTGTEIDTTPPRVSTTSPEAGETGFPANGTIIANFSEVIDPTSLTSTNFSISGNPGGSLTLTDQTVAFTPSPNLAFLTPYIVVIRPGVKDLAGNRMSDTYSWVFSTSDSLSSVCIFDTGLFNVCLYD